MKNSQQHITPARSKRNVSIVMYLNDGLNVSVTQLLQRRREHFFKMVRIQQGRDAEQENTFDGVLQQRAAIVIQHAGHREALLYFRELVMFDELLRMRSEKRDRFCDSAAGLHPCL